MCHHAAANSVYIVYVANTVYISEIKGPATSGTVYNSHGWLQLTTIDPHQRIVNI